MNHRFLLEALDRTLRDIMHLPHTPFGGKVILLAGDFRQVKMNGINFFMLLLVYISTNIQWSS